MSASDRSHTSRQDPSTPARTPALRIKSRRKGNAPIAVLAFLLLFAILLVSVSNFYLLPAISAAKNATPDEKRRLMAYSRLLLAIVLFILLVGLMMTFRIGRFFFPRARGPRTQTKYIDVWAEAGRRLDTAEPEEQND
jgi:hypothetical protein